jgi:hypothetical protein
MGKAGRAVCIFTPMALTIASFVCVLLINLGGISKSSTTLNNLHFFTADFTNFTTDSSTLGTVINLAKKEGFISNKYEIFLWNYCDTGNGRLSMLLSLLLRTSLALVLTAVFSISLNPMSPAMPTLSTTKFSTRAPASQSTCTRN